MVLTASHNRLLLRSQSSIPLMGYGYAEVSESGVCWDPEPGGFTAPSPGGHAAGPAARFLMSHTAAARLHCEPVWIWNHLDTLFRVYL